MADAIFCARFVMLLHKLDTPNFSTLQYFNSVLSQVVLGIFCCSEGEAVRLGRFLREAIATLESWRSSRDVYLKESYSKRGMAASFSDPSKRVSFEQFPRILHKCYLQTTKVTRIQPRMSEQGGYINMYLRRSRIVWTLESTCKSRMLCWYSRESTMYILRFAGRMSTSRSA